MLLAIYHQGFGQFMTSLNVALETVFIPENHGLFLIVYNIVYKVSITTLCPSTVYYLYVL